MDTDNIMCAKNVLRSVYKMKFGFRNLWRKDYQERFVLIDIELDLESYWLGYKHEFTFVLCNFFFNILWNKNYKKRRK